MRKVRGRRKALITSTVSFALSVTSIVIETFDRGVDLTKDDLQCAYNLWDEVINPYCIEFEERTKKPAQAMCEAIAGVIARRANQRSSWNAWQRLWWHKLPEDHDKADQGKSVTFYNALD